MSTNIIDASIGNPIIMSDRFISRNIFQKTPNDILYQIEQPKDIIALLKRYLLFLDEDFDTSLNVIISPGGSTLAIAASLYAIQKLEDNEITVRNALSPPYYSSYIDIVGTMKNSRWVSTDSKSTVKMITSPNNPDGRLVDPNIKSRYKSKYIILDAVYDNPQFTGRCNTVNSWKYEYFKSDYFCEVNSISKIGFAGIRFGYIVTRNKELAYLANEYIENMNLGQNRSSNTTFVTRYDELNNEILYQNIYRQLHIRHEQIREIIPKRFIRSNNRVPYVFFELPMSIFDSVDIISMLGTSYGVSNRYSRISIMIGEEDWIDMLCRFRSDKFMKYIEHLSEFQDVIFEDIDSHFITRPLYYDSSKFIVFILVITFIICLMIFYHRNRRYDHII